MFLAVCYIELSSGKCRRVTEGLKRICNHRDKRDGIVTPVSIMLPAHFDDVTDDISR